MVTITAIIRARPNAQNIMRDHTGSTMERMSGPATASSSASSTIVTLPAYHARKAELDPERSLLTVRKPCRPVRRRNRQGVGGESPPR